MEVEELEVAMKQRAEFVTEQSFALVVVLVVEKYLVEVRVFELEEFLMQEIGFVAMINLVEMIVVSVVKNVLPPLLSLIAMLVEE
jgi:hypothetical protein